MLKRTSVVLWAALLTGGLSTVCLGEPEVPSDIQAPVTVTAQRDLDFEDVFPGVNKSIVITDLTSGKWLVQGDAWTWVTITFPGLPALLTSGGNIVPIVYSGTDAAYYRNDDPGSATSFDPAVGTNAMFWGAGTLYVWIGGTVQPTESAPSGSYSATITLDAVYVD